MTRRDRLLLSGFVFLVLAGVLWLMVVSPKRQDVTRLGDEIVTAQSQLDAAEQQNAATAAARRNFGADVEAMKALARALPDEDQTAALLYQLNKASGDADIKLKSITPGAVGVAPTGSAAATPLPAGVQEMGLDLTFEGRYTDLQRFLTRLQHSTAIHGEEVAISGRLINIKHVQLQVADDKAGVVVATIGGAAYVSAPVTPAGQPGTTTPGAPATAATPAPAAATTPPAQTASVGATG
jgi:Tfp pilus assembly protein PilO